MPEFLDLDLKADWPRGGGAGLPQLIIHRAEHGVAGMSKIDREEDPAGDRIARIGADLDEADCRARIRRVGMADAVDGIDHTGGADQRVAPLRHRRRPGMSLLPGDGNLVPALALG